MRSASRIFFARRRRLISAWMGIFALALPLLAPIAQGIPAFGDLEKSGSPFYMVICKAMQDGTGNGPDDNSDANDCPVCLSFAFGHSLVFAPLDMAVVTPAEPPLFPLPSQAAFHPNRLASWSPARAPPTIV